jgi:pyruvate/2-oxoacid:ferredoxin oxidoreductase beta subunit
MEDPRITQPLDVEISGFTDPQRSPSLDIGVETRDAPEGLTV